MRLNTWPPRHLRPPRAPEDLPRSPQDHLRTPLISADERVDPLKTLARPSWTALGPFSKHLDYKIIKHQRTLYNALKNTINDLLRYSQGPP